MGEVEGGGGVGEMEGGGGVSGGGGGGKKVEGSGGVGKVEAPAQVRGPSDSSVGCKRASPSGFKPNRV